MQNGLGPVDRVGINGIELYFPRNYVCQSDLEKFDKVSSGKYTLGLGQLEMGFCADNEDIVSIAMTATKNLLEKYEVSSKDIGFLAVGTETLNDKSKSVKTALMDLFGDNTDIEGVDVKNACFGGTQALLHAIDWVYTKYQYEKRMAIVVLADIAIYESGPARCTGGAGAMALLVAPNAAVPIDRRTTSMCMKNTWDFYKPIGAKVTEYPTVNGPESLTAYVDALESCYRLFKSKNEKFGNERVHLGKFDGIFFHCPFTKQVRKGLAILCNIDCHMDECASGKKLMTDRDKMNAAIEASQPLWAAKTDEFLVFNRRIGNMYTPSLFAQLLGFLASDEISFTNGVAPGERSLYDPRLLFFAYGSGFASAMFSASVVLHSPNLFKMREVAKEALSRLDERTKLSPEDFTRVLEMRERFLVANVPTTPEALKEMDNGLQLFSKTFYLKEIDGRSRRFYERFE